MNVRKVIIFTATLVVSSAQAYSVNALTEDSFKALSQTATKIVPEEVPPVDEDELEELLGECPVYPACPPIF